MTLRHVIVSLAAVWAVAACSNDDTIVALNVSSSDAVPVVDRLHVTITQGSRNFERDFAPPIETPEAPEGMEAPPPSIQNRFFERITLSGDWDEEPATVTVEAFQADGSAFDPPLTDETTVTIQPDGVVAAFVDFDIVPPDTAGGAGGAGGAEAGGAGGTDDGVGGASGRAGSGLGGDTAALGGAGGQPASDEAGAGGAALAGAGGA